jgi:hypothetical protein
MAGKQRPVSERFWSYVDISDQCWKWTGSVTNYGYGRLHIGGRDGRDVGAHRIAWELLKGRIPEGLYVCHHCDNPICVNPAHLFLGTQSDNMQDAGKKNRLPQQKYHGFCAGERNGRAKLTDAQVSAIRKEYQVVMSHRKLAAKYKVSRSIIRFILSGKNWKHVK